MLGTEGTDWLQNLILGLTVRVRSGGVWERGGDIICKDQETIVAIQQVKSGEFSCAGWLSRKALFYYNYGE